MGRQNVPTAILELRNSFKKHPERKRNSEPETTGEFDKNHPSYFDESQIAAWSNIIDIVPVGVLTNADHIHVEIIATLLAEFRYSGALMPSAKLNRLTSEMGKIGLNPSSRSSLIVDQKSNNKYSDD